MVALNEPLQLDLPAHRLTVRSLGSARLLSRSDQFDGRLEAGETVLAVQLSATPRARALFVQASGSQALPLHLLATAIQSESVAGDALAALAESARQLRCELRMVMIELGGSESVDDVNPEELRRIMGKRYRPNLETQRAPGIVATVCAGGLPPLLQLAAEGFTLPVRSWVPAGLTEKWRPLCQSVECRSGDRFVCHVEPAGEESLRAFHDAIRARPFSGELPASIAAGAEIRIEERQR